MNVLVGKITVLLLLFILAWHIWTLFKNRYSVLEQGMFIDRYENFLEQSSENYQNKMYERQAMRQQFTDLNTKLKVSIKPSATETVFSIFTNLQNN